MALQHRRDADAADLVPLPGSQAHELELRIEDRKVDREGGRLLLPAQRCFQAIVAAVDHDTVAGHEGRHEERQPHDVVPVQMGQEDVKGLRGAAVLLHRGLAEGAQAAAHVADEVVEAAGLDLHAGGVAAVGALGREGQAGDDALHVGLGVERSAARGKQRGLQFLAHAVGRERHRQRAARAPKVHAHHGGPPAGSSLLR